MVNSSEEKIKMILEGKGWTVYNRGSPDFLVLCLDKYNYPDDRFAFVEVKKDGKSRISNYQLQWHDILCQLGATCEFVDASDSKSIENLLRKLEKVKPIKNIEYPEYLKTISDDELFFIHKCARFECNRRFKDPSVG